MVSVLHEGGQSRYKWLQNLVKELRDYLSGYGSWITYFVYFGLHVEARFAQANVINTKGLALGTSLPLVVRVLMADLVSSFD